MVLMVETCELQLEGERSISGVHDAGQKVTHPELGIRPVPLEFDLSLNKQLSDGCTEHISNRCHTAVPVLGFLRDAHDDLALRIELGGAEDIRNRHDVCTQRKGAPW